MIGMGIGIGMAFGGLEARLRAYLLWALRLSRTLLAFALPRVTSVNLQ